MTPLAGLPGPPPGPLRSGTRRPRVLLTVLAALAATAIALTGCASPGSGGGGGTPAKVSLTFQVTHGTGPAFQHWTLRCDPSGGTQPAAAASCSSLLKLKNPFAPPKPRNCPMILRSDRRIVVSGTWFGEKVHRVILDGGCDMNLFSKVHQMFH